MSIAKGSRSQLIWKLETTYGVAATGNYNQFPLNNETFDENINTIQGEDIRSDRANPAMRGGNISTGGQVTHDFGHCRMITLMEHLLASTRSSSSSPITIAELAAS